MLNIAGKDYSDADNDNSEMYNGIMSSFLMNLIYVERTEGVMVWGAIAQASRSPLVFIQNNMTALHCPQ